MDRRGEGGGSKGIQIHLIIVVIIVVVIVVVIVVDCSLRWSSHVGDGIAAPRDGTQKDNFCAIGDDTGDGMPLRLRGTEGGPDVSRIV